MNDEKITVSPIRKIDEVRSYSRKQYYDEIFQDNVVPKFAVHVVNMFIITTSGEVLLQKRAAQKRHNPRLIDKSLGGHVVYGDHTDYTVMVETVQELLTPSIVLKNEKDFEKTYSLLGDYLNTVALIKHRDVIEMTLDKLVDGKLYSVPNVVHMYLGIYDGSTKPADKESSGMLYYRIEDLEEEMLSVPEQFSDDVKKLFAMFKPDLLALLQRYNPS